MFLNKNSQSTQFEDWWTGVSTLYLFIFILFSSILMEIENESI